ncbi:MAG: glycosyl transferase [Chitinophagaceae bacterium]|nr:glycosyl transferase [Chitinophagaceae bacterium]
MKILYAVQATGNGHISRAIEILPFIQQYGEVDIFLSGSNSNLQAELPIKYRSKGLSLFYGNKGGLDYWKMLKDCSLVSVWKEANSLPVEKYDIVLNDFDCITALACKLKGKPSIGFGHQASFQSKHTPRTSKKDIAGEWVLHQYAKASAYVGLHFEAYDQFIFSPILKSNILHANPTNKKHITVYLSHYSDDMLMHYLYQHPDIYFEVFSKRVKTPTRSNNIRFIPISNEAFTKSMIESEGVITGAGFETPAEALYLGKKLMCLPIRGQYEQLCNAAALKNFGITIVNKIDSEFTQTINSWLSSPNPKPLTLQHTTYEIVQHVMELGRALLGKKEEEVYSPASSTCHASTTLF